MTKFTNKELAVIQKSLQTTVRLIKAVKDYGITDKEVLSIEQILNKISDKEQPIPNHCKRYLKIKDDLTNEKDMDEIKVGDYER